MKKRTKNECAHLQNDYFYRNPCLKHNGFHVLTENFFSKVIRNLQQFDSPDMYAVVGNKIIIIEHFEFDASKRTQDGMLGKREEALLKKELADMPADNGVRCFKKSYESSFENWNSNFEETFMTHYGKISQYKEKIADFLQLDANKEIVVGFFIENQFSPIVDDGISCGQLNYCETLQFAEKIMSSKELDFALFGCYCEGVPQLFYADAESFKNIEKFVDIKSESLRFSVLNKNECAWAMKRVEQTNDFEK